MNPLVRTVSLLTLALSAGTASADVTPAEVWEAFRAQAEAMGYEVTSEVVSESERSLVLGDVRYRFEMPEEGSVEVLVRGLRFDADGSGAVTGDFGNVAMAMAIADSSGETVESEMVFEAPGQSVVFTGTPQDMLGVYDWPVADLRLTALRVDGEPLDVTGTIQMLGTEGRYRYSLDDAGVPAVESEMTAASVSLEADIDVPEEDPEHVRVFFTVADVSASGSALAGVALMQGVPAAHGASSVSYGMGQFEAQLDGSNGETHIIGGFDAGFAETEFQDGRLIYRTGSDGLSLSGSDPQFPIEGELLRIGQTRNYFEMPLMANEDPQGFALHFALSEVSIGDDIWGIFDPLGILSHDPMSFELSVSGEAVLTEDLGSLADDPEAMAEAPGEFRSIRLDDLALQVLGAELTGQGSADFEPGALMPAGTFDFRLLGVMTAVGQLTELGWLDPFSAGMAQMMLGLYTVPEEGGDGDAWVSHVEITPDGGVLVNGVPMQ